MLETVKTSNLGYPRLGEKREWKQLLESYWRHEIDDDQFEIAAKRLRLLNLQKQLAFGVTHIPVADNSNYDHVLDTMAAFNLMPERFGSYDRPLHLSEYFAVARGTDKSVPADMTKWFNTNYHYTVPEFDHTQPRLLDNRWLRYWQEAKDALHIDGKPVILGPVSLIKLGKINGTYITEADHINTLLDQLLPIYGEVFQQLAAAGVSWVQLDEPTLVQLTHATEVLPYQKMAAYLHRVAPTINIVLQTYFDAIDPFEAVMKLPVQAIGLDFVHDHGENLKHIQQIGFPKDKILAAGIIDGHNVWASDLTEKVQLAKTLQGYAPKIWLQPSNSLLHVPITTKYEAARDDTIYHALAFADEKIKELGIIAKACNQQDVTKALTQNQQALNHLKLAPFRHHPNVKARVNALDDSQFKRKSDYHTRQKIQAAALKLPFLPTTTIGSFPQSATVRAKRAAWRQGKLTDQAYDTFIASEIKRWIRLQERIGLDVLVHGEFERTDMVEYFGQKLGGFLATKNGWVQSYGSRAVHPPVIYGDVYYQEPITVDKSLYAQSLTDKPVKGMITAPLTIINWSFVRDDITRATVQNQIALALREEVLNLEQAGIKIIQVDEPALREGLPLKVRHWQAYLDAAVAAFKITTTGVQDQTQIHTHMCYSDFDDIIDTITNLDADVISIETARSRGEIIAAFERTHYTKQIGLGVYDIHATRLPSISEIAANIQRGLQVINPKQFWVNPDCGLKTRTEEQVIIALTRLQAARDRVVLKHQEA